MSLISICLHFTDSIGPGVQGSSESYDLTRRWPACPPNAAVCGARSASARLRGYGAVTRPGAAFPRLAHPLRSRPCRVQAVTLLKQLQRLLYVVWLFGEAFRIPLFARHTEEVATVNMNGAGQTPDRVRHGMNDIVAQGNGVAFAQRLGAGRLDSAIGLARQPTPEDVVLPSRIDTNDGPHL